MITLNNIQKTKTSKGIRKGRGEGSGKGKNAGRGHKGQVKRAGKMPVGFEGGMRSLMKRTPKYKGFKVRNNYKHAVTVTLAKIEKEYADGETVNLETLVSKGIVSDKTKKVRIVNSGKLTKKVSITESDQVYLTKGVKDVIK